MGKILLAFGGDAAFRDFAGPSQRFKRFTPYTIVSPRELKRELGNVAQQGYAISDQEAALGCRCIAVPVRNPHRKFIAALSISSTPENFGDAALPRLLSKLFTAAEIIGRETPD